MLANANFKNNPLSFYLRDVLMRVCVPDMISQAPNLQPYNYVFIPVRSAGAYPVVFASILDISELPRACEAK